MLELSEVLKKKVAVISFGRMNPPTNGHEKLLNKVLSTAKSTRGDPFLFLSHTQDAKKNPLSSNQKEKYIKLGIPSISKHIVNDSNIRTIFDALNYLIKLGYNNVILVVGSDRVKEFDSLVKKYIKHPDPSKSVNLDSFSVISAGDRDPDSEGISGISASKMREFVKRNNFFSFKKGVPSKLSDKYAEEMFNDLKKSMRIIEMIESVKKISNSLNIPRNKMPQIKEVDINSFIKYIKDSDISVASKKLPINILKPTQNQINMEKVKTKYDKIKNNYKIKPFIVSSDNHILDGHHQLFALKLLYKNIKVDCNIVNLKMKDLLSLAHNFPKTTYKNIQDEYTKYLNKFKNENGNGMKTLKEILEEVGDIPSETDKVKERQEREKEQLSIKHARQLERAKEQDFEKKQTETRQKEKEKLIQKNINK